MNPGLLTCEASALPLSYIPDDVSQFVFPTCLVKQARQQKKKQNKQKNKKIRKSGNNNNSTKTTNSTQHTHKKKWRYRDLNPGLLTCEASALPLSYIPAVVSQFVFPTCLVKQARQKNKKTGDTGI